MVPTCAANTMRSVSTRTLGQPAGRRDVSASASTSGRTCVVTGGNAGIGFETARALLSRGDRVVLACRDMVKAERACSSLREAVPGAAVSASELDLADLASVRSFARRFLDSGEPLDVLVNNAGIMACPLMRTKDGFEMQLGVNHLGHFALTLELLPRLSDPSRSSRVVTVSSAAHLAGSMNFNDLNSQRGYQRWVAYSQSKLANVLMTYELARRTPNTARLTANTLHPGVVATDLARFLLPSESEMPWAAKAAAGLMRNFLKTPEQGAQTSICLSDGRWLLTPPKRCAMTQGAWPVRHP